jgi:hypothetical protein
MQNYIITMEFNNNTIRPAVGLYIRNEEKVIRIYHF